MIRLLGRTCATVKLAQALMAHPDERHYPTSEQTGLHASLVARLMARMRENGWLADGLDQQVKGCPPRRYYTVTERGRREMRTLLEG